MISYSKLETNQTDVNGQFYSRRDVGVVLYLSEVILVAICLNPLTTYNIVSIHLPIIFGHAAILIVWLGGIHIISTPLDPVRLVLN